MPFKSTLENPAVVPEFVYPVIGLSLPKDKAAVTPVSLQSASSRSGTADIVPVPAPNVILI